MTPSKLCRFLRRENLHLYLTSTGLEEAPQKSSLSLVAMRAVEKHSPPEQHCSPKQRNQAYLLPCPVFQGCFLGFYLRLCTTQCQLQLLPQGRCLQPEQQICGCPVVRHQTHQCKLHPDCWPWGTPWRQGKNTIKRIVDPGMAELWMVSG